MNAEVGIYADRVGRPGALLTQGTITSLTPGSWNYVDVPSLPVTKGRRYWIALLVPSGGGTVSFRDRTGAGRSQISARHNLSVSLRDGRGQRFADHPRNSLPTEADDSTGG